jgi:hypothetical protein
MSMPLFIEVPTVGSGTAAVTGQSLAAYSGSTPMADITEVVAEPTLIETIGWSVHKFSTQAGMLLLGISDGTNRRIFGAYPIAAGAALLFASDSIAVNLTIEPGYKLVAAHNVQDAGSAYVDLDLVPFGGVVRASGVLYGSSLPDPDVFYRGKTFTVFGADGVGDDLYVCVKLGSGGYSWFPLGMSGTLPGYPSTSLPNPSDLPLRTQIATTDTQQVLINFDNTQWKALS